MRRQMSQSLIREQWIREAVNLTEKSKVDSETLDEYFQNEMKILLHDNTLQNRNRHMRFVQLIDKVQSEKVIDGKPQKLTGVVIGTALLWARARFEQKQIQINKFNKLTLEVFSRISAPIRIQQLTIAMSQGNLNQVIDFSQDENAENKWYNLSKNNPIKLERQFYLQEEDNQIGEIILNQIVLELAPKLTAAMDNLGSLQAPQICNKLLFSISPYLAPEVSLIELSQKTQVIKRLPPPIMY